METKAKNDLNLSDDFIPADYKIWKAAAEKSLTEKDFNKILSNTCNGIELKPIYNKEDLAGLNFTNALPAFPPYARGYQAAGYSAKPWLISQSIPYISPAEFNSAVLQDLNAGQTAVVLELNKISISGVQPENLKLEKFSEHGTVISTFEDLTRTLNGIDLSKIPLFIKPGPAALPVMGLLSSYLKKQKLNSNYLTGGLLFDPIAEVVVNGTLPCPLKTFYEDTAIIAKWTEQNVPLYHTIAVDAVPYHNAGANAVQELACALATGVEYIRQLSQRGLTINSIAEQMYFIFAAGPDFFIEIAKVRAARILWHRVLNAFGLADKNQIMQIHIETGKWKETRLELSVNMLRATTEAFSAIIAGCDSLCVEAFNSASKLPDDFSRRIARNTQLILNEEVRAGQVIDPAGGSWYVENLTCELAQKAWSLFQQIEAKGGIVPALQAGFIQKLIAETASTRKEIIETGQVKIAGADNYPNLAENEISEDLADLSKFIASHKQYLAEYKNNRDNKKFQSALAELQRKKNADPEQFFQALQNAVDSNATLPELYQALYGSEKPPETIEPLHIERGAGAA